MDDFDPVGGHDEEVHLLLVAVHEVDLVYRSDDEVKLVHLPAGGGSNLILGWMDKVDLVHDHEDEVDLVHQSEDEVDLVLGHEEEVDLVASTTRSTSSTDVRIRSTSRPRPNDEVDLVLTATTTKSTSSTAMTTISSSPTDLALTRSTSWLYDNEVVDRRPRRRILGDFTYFFFLFYIFSMYFFYNNVPDFLY